MSAYRVSLLSLEENVTGAGHGLTEPGPGSPTLYLLFASSGSKYADGGDCGLPCDPKGMGLANPPVQFSIAETFHPEERLWLPCQDMIHN